MSVPYAELDCMTNFSFLEGASHARELSAFASVLGLHAVGVADRNTLAGVVRMMQAEKVTGAAYKVGCRLVFTDGASLIVYPRDRQAYGRLCRLLSAGKKEAPKGQCFITFEQAAVLGDGLIALVPAGTASPEILEARLNHWIRLWPDELYLAAAPLHRGDDRARLNALAQVAARTGAPLVATNAVRFHTPERRPLADVLTCIREKTTLQDAGWLLEANAERCLKPGAEMLRLFKGHESAIRRTVEIADRIRFNLKELRYEYPDEPIPPGKTPQQHLEDLTWRGAQFFFPQGLRAEDERTIRKELAVIERMDIAKYFLTVHSIVDFAKSRGILCQGRGSAANSIVCYCLGITAVNPTEVNLLFERFVSEERQEPPDIDVDFEHERREEVIQHIYERYGRDRAAIAATVISYRPRSAVREVGKVLGLTEDVTGALAGTVWGAWGDSIFEEHVRRAGLDPNEPRLRMTLQLAHELIGFPRHLSQHVGGFVLTRGLLIDTVPVGNGAMKDRTFCEWDKDDLHELELMKVDVLALGMLTAIKKAFDMLERDYGREMTLAAIPRQDDAVFDMLCQADSLGVFQVESRAQMNMLPRLKPRKFYDLVVEVAIVRPGPIQGDMVHPYLRRRNGLEPVEYPAPQGGDPDELKRVLEKTLGVPLFQEQAMRIAIEAAGFTPDEANQLRRAMATFRHVGTIGQLHSKLVDGMVRRGYDRDFAERCFKQIEGFGEYGFPESHAASFALLVYASSWIKLHYPEVFCAALLNSQPMGFYAPAQIVRDAKEHGTEVRQPDINSSDWDCTLELRPSGRSGLPLRHAVRLGFRQIDGFRREWAERLAEERLSGGPFVSIDELRARTRLPAAALDALASADAVQSLELSRRRALWAAKGLPAPKPAPLFEFAGLHEGDGQPPDALPVAPLSDEVIQDYQMLRLSLKAHPLSFLRRVYDGLGAVTAERTAKVPDGGACAVAGVVLVRQMPGSAKGVVFMTLEDETGVVNTVVWPSVFETYRPIAMGARLVLARGRIQRSDGVTHLVVESLEDRSGDLADLSEAKFNPPFARSDEVTHPMPAKGGGGGVHPKPPSEHANRGAMRGSHPRDVRILPRAREFH